MSTTNNNKTVGGTFTEVPQKEYAMINHRKKILGDAFIGRFEDMLGNCNQLRELYFYHFPARLLTALHNNNQNNEAIIPRLQQVSVKLELTHQSYHKSGI